MNDEEVMRLKLENAELRQQLSLKPCLQRMGLRNDAFGYVRSMLEERYDLGPDGDFVPRDRLNTPASWHRWAESLRSSHDFLFTRRNFSSGPGSFLWAQSRYFDGVRSMPI